MQLLLAVIDDLFQFAHVALFGASIQTYQQTQNEQSLVQQHTPQLQLPTIADTQSISQQGQNADSTASFVQGSLYFVGEPRAFLYVEPVIAFDTASMQLAYGTQLQVLKLGGRWAEVTTEGTQGWVLKDVLREQIADVFPIFSEGVLYDAYNEQTQKLRLTLEDSFGGNAALLPLTDAEYVTFKLERRGVQIPWTLERPRGAGTWQRKLRGRVGVHMSIAPYAGTVMEYSTEENSHLCFVEAVFPDESIKITSVSIFEEGMYTEVLMNKDQWKELRPVFIEMT